MYYLYRASMLTSILFLNLHGSDQSTPDSSPTPNVRQSALPVNGIIKDIAKGSAMAVGEVLVPGQPLSYWMNRVIDGKQFRFTRSYEGFGPNAIGQMPITAIQVMVESQATQALRAYQHTDPNNAQKLGISF